MTFRQQLFLIIVDKLVITLIVGGAVIWVQKKIEAFKARQSLDTEIAKQRVANIAAGWKALNAWDLIVTDVISVGTLPRREDRSRPLPFQH